jgi:hypothetical protein
MDDKCYILNVDGPSVLKIELHVPHRRELERKFEIVLFVENARMALKSSANESWHLPGSNAPSFVAIQAEMTELKEGSKNSQITAAEATHKVGIIANEL